MKKIFIFVILLFAIGTATIYSDINYTLEGKVQTAPWFYETIYKMDCISFSTMWMAGIQLDWFTIGLDMYSDYVSLNGKEEGNSFKGSWFNVGGAVATRYEITSRIECEFHAGTIWKQSSFDFTDSGWLGRGLLGLEIIASSNITITSFLSLEIINKLDLFFSQDSSIDDMNYTFGVRTYINPGLQWLKVYGELDAFYWNYKSEILPDGLSSWMFQIQMGVSLKIDKNVKENVITVKESDETVKILTDETTESSPPLPDDKDPEIDNPEKQYSDPGLTQLKNSKAGDKILFYSIQFDNESLLNESLPVLDGIAEILLENETLVISVQGYATFMQDPLKELELSKTRAIVIKNYLVTSGVEEARVIQNPMGNIITDKDTYILINVIVNDRIDS
ncbi:MAG: OmpA family protein [Spirochaetales bacterium]|nr:OmpA family protein [Spirochaetales bacterium]